MAYTIEQERRIVSRYSGLRADPDKPQWVQVMEYLRGWKMEDMLVEGKSGEDDIAYHIANYIYGSYSCDISMAEVRSTIVSITKKDDCAHSTENIIKYRSPPPPSASHQLVGMRYWTETGWIYCRHCVKWIWINFDALRDKIASKCMSMFYRCPYCGQYFLTGRERDLHVYNKHYEQNGNGNGEENGNDVQQAGMGKNLGIMAAGGLGLYLAYMMISRIFKKGG